MRHVLRFLMTSRLSGRYRQLSCSVHLRSAKETDVKRVLQRGLRGETLRGVNSNNSLNEVRGGGSSGLVSCELGLPFRGHRHYHQQQPVVDSLRGPTWGTWITRSANLLGMDTRGILSFSCAIARPLALCLAWVGLGRSIHATVVTSPAVVP